MPQPAADRPWERQPGEPGRWYACLEIYRLLGTQRTIEEAYRRYVMGTGRQARRPSTTWYTMARQWEWQARAEAWDAAERDHLRSQEADRRFDTRELRLAFIGRLLDSAFSVMMKALESITTVEEARKMLPVTRLLFKDMLMLQRIEMGAPAVTPAATPETVPPYTADELAVAARAVREWHNEIGMDPEGTNGKDARYPIYIARYAVDSIRILPHEDGVGGGNATHNAG